MQLTPSCRLLFVALFGFTFMLVYYYRHFISVYTSRTVIVSSRWLESATGASTYTVSNSNNNQGSSCSQPERTNTSDVWFSAFLLIVVPIRPLDNQDSRRQLVRETWFEGFNNSQDVALRFIVGTKAMESDEQVKLTEENGTFGDIIFVDTKEDFNALTNKTLAFINWAHRHVKFSYLLKCDDDTYVFVKNMIVELKKRPTTTKLYYGIMHVNRKPKYGEKKWADNSWNLGSNYLPFALGGGYILSHDLVSFVSRQSPHLMWHINEDTAVGAWVSVLDHEQRSDGKFCFWWKGHTMKSVCEYPLLAFLLFKHNGEELEKHFHYFHEHSNDSITIFKYINSGNTTAIHYKA